MMHFMSERIGAEAFYAAGSRALQVRFDSGRVADALAEKLVHARITPQDREFLEQADMFFMATVDGRGRVNCSYKGGEPGFVRVLDEHTLAFPSYGGNGMYLSAGSLAETGQVGLLFIDFERPRRLRLNGTATLDPSDELMPRFPEAQFVVRVRAREIFVNCPRRIHQMTRAGASNLGGKPDVNARRDEGRD
jgi:predicted pyridoxine 5'-phosphate oxidase superfamily flavin-nucleotide-binding protein